MPADVTAAVLRLAIDVCGCDAEGFRAVKMLAKEMTGEQVAHVVDVVHAKLVGARKHKSINARNVMDSAVACLGVVAMDIVRDEFPVADFAPLVLQWMPAGVNREENEDLMRFFAWMAGREAVVEACAEEMCRVCVRVFGQPQEKVAGLGIGAETLGRIRAEFARIIAAVPGGMVVVEAMCHGSEEKMGYVQAALEAAQE
jgi:hypothetical protein